MDDDFLARLLDQDRRLTLLVGLHSYHRALGAPVKLSTYFIQRMEQALYFYEHNPRRCREEVDALVHDFGFMGYFDQTLELINGGLRAPYRTVGFERRPTARNRVA